MLGGRIRSLRQEHRLTVRQLATSANLSPALISQVERDLTDPSLDSLRRIAQALGVPLFDLFQEPEETAVAVVRSEARTRITTPHGELTYARLTPGMGKLEVLEGVLQPGAASSREPWSHPSEECAVVTSGTLTVEVGTQRYLLEAGDSCRFDSRLPHRYVNEQTTPAVFLLSVTPPSF